MQWSNLVSNKFLHPYDNPVLTIHEPFILYISLNWISLNLPNVAIIWYEVKLDLCKIWPIQLLVVQHRNYVQTLICEFFCYFVLLRGRMEPLNGTVKGYLAVLVSWKSICIALLHRCGHQLPFLFTSTSLLSLEVISLFNHRRLQDQKLALDFSHQEIARKISVQLYLIKSLVIPGLLVL